jgi:WhiB family redox-sensing transcriptional regulator
MSDVSRLPGPQAELWDWQRHAQCRGMGTETFFHPENERGPRRANRDAAGKAVCRRCPVIDECARHALAAREPFGIWGGLNEQEREDILSGKVRWIPRKDALKDRPLVG